MLGSVARHLKGKKEYEMARPRKPKATQATNELLSSLLFVGSVLKEHGSPNETHILYLMVGLLPLMALFLVVVLSILIFTPHQIIPF